jgi:hypothetical protein
LNTTKTGTTKSASRIIPVQHFPPVGLFEYKLFSQ